MIIPVILAGGIGSRLWPHSRSLLPKQFINFPQQQGSLFQITLERLDGLEEVGDPIVLCNENHRFLVAEQLRLSGQEKGSILLEPVGRNTAPAVAMAALQASSVNPDSILLILPADHLIQNTGALHESIIQGQSLASRGNLVTFGIVPGAPETGYGYIRKGKPIDRSTGFAVESFVEKPDFETAKAYLASGDYYWNSGIFMMQASAYLEELDNHAPDILASCQKAFSGMSHDVDYSRIPLELFEQCRSDSIDYAVMEKTDRAAVIPLNANWNDLGAWTAVWDIAEKDNQNNAVNGDVLLEAVSNSYIQAGSRLVAAVGVTDMIIIETTDAVLVAAKDNVQEVKKIVDQLEAMDRSESHNHDLVYRPWGSYESLVNTNGYQVKHIVVNPGAALSLQLHHHRAEHWTIVHGEARITRDDQVYILKANESIFLPLGCKHRLENPGLEPVELIEVQVGDYLGEDDIVRFDDVYGRIGQ